MTKGGIFLRYVGSKLFLFLTMQNQPNYFGPHVLNFRVTNKSAKPPAIFKLIGHMKSLIKFGLSEKHTKFEKNLPNGLDVY